MRRNLHSRKVRAMVRKLARAHLDDANGVLDRLDPAHRTYILSLLAATGDPRWRERLPQPGAQMEIVKQEPAAVRAPDPHWLKERTSAPDGASGPIGFFRITPAALSALHDAKSTSVQRL